MNKNKGHTPQSDEGLLDEETKSYSSGTKGLEPVPNIDTQYEYNSSDESSCDSFTTRTLDLDIFEKDVAEWDREDIAAFVSWLRENNSLDLDINKFPSDGKALLAMKGDIAKLVGANGTRFFELVFNSPKCAYSAGKIKKRRPLHKKKEDCQIPDRWFSKYLPEFLSLGPDQLKVTKPMQKVYSRMTELWPSLEKHNLDPLITRLADNIIEVKEEKGLSEKSGC